MTAGASATGRVLDFRTARPFDMAGEVVDAVFLCLTEEQGLETAWLVEPWKIRLHAAVSEEQSSRLLASTHSRVLVCADQYAGGNWRQRLATLECRRPYVAMIVILPGFDGAAWVEALRGGVYDVLPECSPSCELAEAIRRAHDWAAGRPASCGQAAWKSPVDAPKG